MAKKEKQDDTSSLKISPAKSMVDELDLLDVLLRQVADQYIARISGEIHQLRCSVYNLALQDTIPSEKIRDLREMLTITRALQTRPEKGRRKDLKRIDDLLNELKELAKDWRHHS